MVFSIVFGSFGITVHAESLNETNNRISGDDRYKTAFEIAKIKYDNPDTVIIVRGDGPAKAANIVDGLTASGLAGALDAPILLVEQERIPEWTKAALKFLNPKKVIIIGGESAVSKDVVLELEKEFDLSVDRIQGKDRYETAANTAKKMAKAVGNMAIIVGGNDENLVDSLTAGPLATKGYPILLVNNQKNEVPEATLKAIQELEIDELIIIGGEAAVSKKIEEELEKIPGVNIHVRLAGKDRYETSVEVAEYHSFKEIDYTYLVNGSRFVDAVAASILGGPMVYFNEARQEIPESVKGLLSRKTTFYVVGGIQVVPSELVKKAHKVQSGLEDNELPERYDLREKDRLTRVKNQGNTDACWAFASTSALESVIDGDDLILDSFHLYNNTGYDDIDGIGQYLTAVPYYAAWKGPVLESAANTVPLKQVQEVLYLKPGDTDLLKSKIYQYGAVGSTIGMTTDERYWNPQKFAQYKYNDDMVNHAIALVGWDDNYPKENFSQKPPSDGAFIVKNSWGNGWGDNGYFYVSYYDKSLGYGNNGNATNIVFSKVENNGYFDNNYQHDELGNTASWGTSETEMFANVFTVDQGNEETLEAVSFYALGENTAYEVFVVEEYINNNSFDSMRKIASGSFDYAGYYTVELEEKIALVSGQEIAVIVKITTPDSKSPVAVEVPNGIYNSTSRATSNPGESFVKINGQWVDFYSIRNNGNVCLKAFTRNAYDVSLEGLGFRQKEIVINVGEIYQLDPIFTPHNATNRSIIWSAKNKDVVSIGQDGSLKGMKEGNTTIILSTIDRKFEAECRVVVQGKEHNDRLIADYDLERIIRGRINKITGELTKEDLKNVRQLYIESADIVSLEGLQNLVNLEGINISKNNISDLSPLADLLQLKSIAIYNNPISDITPLSNLLDLNHLTIENANVSNIDAVAGLKELKHICFYGNNIRSIDAISELTKLELVDFVGNEIVKIDALANLKALEKLYIPVNQIRDINPLRDLINLKHLMLGQNPIQDYSPVESYYHNLINKDFSLP